LKVVHLLHSFPPEFRGGTEACVERLALAQVARGDDPVVVAGSDERSEAGEIRSESVEGLAVRRVLRKVGENYSMDNRLPRVAEQVVELIGGLCPDVVHLHHTLNLSGDLASRLSAAGHPVVATLHDFTGVCARFFLLRPDGTSCRDAFPLPSERCVTCVLPDFEAGREALDIEMQARLDTSRAEFAALGAAIAPSAWVAEAWRRSGLLDPARLFVIPHAVPQAGLGSLPARRHSHEGADGRADDRLVLASWGHLAPAKGVTDLLEAMALVDDARLSLVLLGDSTDPDFASALTAAAEGLDVSFR